MAKLSLKERVNLYDKIDPGYKKALRGFAVVYGKERARQLRKKK